MGRIIIGIVLCLVAFVILANHTDYWAYASGILVTLGTYFIASHKVNK